MIEFCCGQFPSDEKTVLAAAMVSHGDDQCLSSEGGINCMVRRMIPGFATILTLPMWVTLDVNDVRTERSAVLSHYTFIAVRLCRQPLRRKPQLLTSA